MANILKGIRANGNKQGTQEAIQDLLEKRILCNLLWSGDNKS